MKTTSKPKKAKAVKVPKLVLMCTHYFTGKQPCERCKRKSCAACSLCPACNPK